MADAWQPNLTWITDHLAVGGRFPDERAAHLAEALGVRAVVDLRAEDRDDHEGLVAHGVAFLHLPTDDLHPSTPAQLDAGVVFVRRFVDRGERALVHCEHGIGRSATLALCVLVDLGLPPVAALTLSKDRRAQVSPSPAQLGGWLRWLERRPEAGTAWPLPTVDELGAVAWRHLVHG